MRLQIIQAGGLLKGAFVFFLGTAAFGAPGGEEEQCKDLLECVPGSFYRYHGNHVFNSFLILSFQHFPKARGSLRYKLILRFDGVPVGEFAEEAVAG